MYKHADNPFVDRSTEKKWGRVTSYNWVMSPTTNKNKKLSYRRETARQLPTWRGLGPPAHSPSGYTYAYGRIRKPQRTYVKRAVHQAHFKMNRAFKVIQGHPYWCRQASRTVCCRNVQLIPTLFLKHTKIWQRKIANSFISTTPLKFEDVPARNAFEYLQMIYIARK